MPKIELKIEGMSCAHCVMWVQQALTKVKGVENATVSLASSTALVEYSGKPNLDAMKTAVDESGYAVAGSREIG